jgi:Xaa-Pro aminopeptidase
MTFARRSLIAVCLLSVQFAFGLDRQPNADYHARREALSKKTDGAAVLLFAAPEGEGPNDIYGYRADNNFFYLSGWSEPGGALLIVPAAEAKGDSPAHPYTEIFFLPNHNFAQEKWTGPKLGPENPDAPKITGFDHVEAIDNLRAELVRLLPSPRATLYTDVAGPGQESISATSIDWLRRANAFPVSVGLLDIRPLIGALRLIKDEHEIELIRKATNASIAAHLSAMHSMKPGITEREISALMQYEWGKRGCERPSYSPIVGSGFYSTVLHYSEDSQTIQSGDVIVIDAAGEYSMYASDITRTLPATGKFTARQKEIYNVVLGAQQAAIAAFQSGKSTLRRDSTNSLQKVAYDYINTHGKDLHGEPLGKYFIHGLSHYVGLEVHDAGPYDIPVGPGTVFTIEPGIYIPEEKIGVRIEDTLYVDKDGKLINLVADLPHTAEDVEKEMSKK